MKKLQKVSAVLLAAMLSVSALAGCTSNPGNTGGKDTNSQTSGGLTASASTDPNKTHKLKILAPEPNHNKFTVFADRDEYPVFQKLQAMFDEQKLELDYELVAAEQFQVVLQTRLASANNLPDIVNVSALDDASVMDMAKQGTVLPLLDLIKQHSNGNIMNMYDNVFPTAKALTLSPEGEMYWFSNLHKKIYGDSTAPIGLGILLRKDWMDKLSLKTPTTTAELKEVLTAFRKQDANGNGKEDEIFKLDTTTFANCLAQYFGLGTDIIAVDPVNKKIVSPWYQDGIKEYFSYVQGLVNDKIIDASLIGSRDLAAQRSAENKVGAQNDYGMATWLKAEVQGVEGVEFMPIMPLKAVDSIKPAAVIEPADLTWNKYVITKACTDTEGAIKLFDVIYTEEYATLCAFGVEGEYYEERDGVKYYLPQGTIEEQAKERKANGNMIWRYVYPLVQLPNLESELADAPKPMADFQLEIMKYDTWYPNGLGNFLAIPTKEETEEINKLSNGIFTYSQELQTKLTMGQLSIDNWAEYTAEFDKLGLPRLIELRQQQLDRFYAAVK